MKINYVKGDATNPIGDGLKVIVHCCNDIGVWGAGFVLAISKKWPYAETAYREHAKNGLHLGDIQIVYVDNDIAVCNLIGQHFVRRNKYDEPPIRYEAIQNGLKELYKYLSKSTTNNVSVHMPKMGAGLAGGDWTIIEKIITKELCDHDIPVTVYEWKNKALFS